MSITDDLMKAHIPDPLNEMSVKDYNQMKIKEKQDELNGCRRILFKTMEDMASLEKELCDLVLEQAIGYQFPHTPKP